MKSFFAKNPQLTEFNFLIGQLELPKIHKHFKSYIWNLDKTLSVIEETFNSFCAKNRDILKRRRLVKCEAIWFDTHLLEHFYEATPTSKQQAERVSF